MTETKTAKLTGEIVYGEIINPSDPMLIDVSDKAAACAAVILVSDGWYGVNDEDGNEIMGLHALNTEEQMLAQFQRETGEDFKEVVKNAARIAKAAATVRFGNFNDVRALNKALEGLPEDEKKRRLKAYAEEQRSSLTNIFEAFERLAAGAEERARKRSSEG